MEAELKCLRAVGSMEERMRNACNAPNASFDSVVKAKYTTLFSFILIYCLHFVPPLQMHHTIHHFPLILFLKAKHYTPLLSMLPTFLFSVFFFLHLLSAFAHTYYSHNRIQVLM